MRAGTYERNYLTHLFGSVTDTGATSTVGRNQALRRNEQDNVYNQTDFVYKKPLFGFNNTLMFGSEFGWENYDFKSKNSTGVSEVSIFNPVLTAGSGSGLASDFSGTLATDRYTEAQTYAGYVLDQFELNPAWKLLVGTRYDQFEAQQFDRLGVDNFSRSDSQWSPRAGLVWQPDKAQTYYFSYGTSFNPSAESLSISEANANLPPEHNRNFEIGGGVFYATDRYADNVNEVTLPGYARLDAVVAYHQKHYDIQMNIFNLTDTVYYESGQTRSALPGMPISGQLSVNFKN